MALNYKLKASAFTAAAVGAGIAGLLWIWWDSYAVLSAALGIALGWALGILLAPYKEEKEKFGGWSKALTGFIGGISLTKLEQALSSLSDKGVLADIIVLRRFIVGVVCLLITTIVVFVFRAYAQISRPS